MKGSGLQKKLAVKGTSTIFQLRQPEQNAFSLFAVSTRSYFASFPPSNVQCTLEDTYLLGDLENESNRMAMGNDCVESRRCENVRKS